MRTVLALRRRRINIVPIPYYFGGLRETPNESAGSPTTRLLSILLNLSPLPSYWFY